MGAITSAVIAGMAGAAGTAAGNVAVAGYVGSMAAATAVSGVASAVGGAVVAAAPYVSVGSGLYSAERTYAAGKEAEDLADKNAATIRAEAEEEVRRVSLQQEAAVGEARAAMGAGGTGQSSLATFLSKVQEEQSADVNWIRRSGTTKSDIARSEGTTTRKQAVASSVGTVANTANTWMQMNPAPSAASA